jgi:hypothetical protein
VAIRVTAWAFVVCAVLGAIGVILPSFELDIHGLRLGRKTSLSLYQAHRDRDFVRRALAAYRRYGRRQQLEDLTGAKLPPQLADRAHLGDAHDAMTSLDAVSDDDVKSADRILAIAIWAFLALQAITAGLVFAGNVRGEHRRGALIGALALAVVVAAAAIAIHIACRQVVWEANDDLGYAAFGLALGAYVIPVASIGTVIAGIALLVQRKRLTASARTPSA